VSGYLYQNYQNMIIGFQVTVKNVGDTFFQDTVYIHGVCSLCTVKNRKEEVLLRV